MIKTSSWITEERIPVSENAVEQMQMQVKGRVFKISCVDYHYSTTTATPPEYILSLFKPNMFLYLI